MAEKKSKAPLFLGGCGCLSLLIGIAMLVAAFRFVKSDASGADHASMQHYRNTPDGRTGNLAESYAGFEFDYPSTWTKKPQDDTNFVAVTHDVDDKTWENLNVGYFKTGGSREANEALYPQLITTLQSQFAQQFQGLTKVHEGPTQVGSYSGYEALFQSTATSGGKPVDVYTRVILLPTPDGSKGVTLLMMGTNFSPDLHSADDLGKKGDLPSILESFRFDLS